MKRALLLVVGLLVLIAVAIVVGVSLVGGDDPVVAPDRPDAATAEAEGDFLRALAGEPVTESEMRRRRLRFPWPFADFSWDIRNARKPTRRAVFIKRQETETAHFLVMAEHKVTIRLENVRVPEVVAALAPQFTDVGLKVYTLDPPVPDQIVFERLYLTDVTVQQVISGLKAMSEGLVDFAVTPEGLCIGSKPACQNARLKALEWEAEVRTEVAQPGDDTFLDVEYRPDFVDAHIGAVIDDILGKTGVQVIADEEAWGAPVSISWRTDPLPLRVALRGIAAEMGVSLIVRDGRAFLLGR